MSGLDDLLDDNIESPLTGGPDWPRLSTVSQYIDCNYRDYANYVVYSRAIPHIIDGFKPSQRKIFFTALSHALNSDVKTASLSGMTIAYSNYHHGDASLNEAINGLTAEYNNNLPVLKGKGSFGSRLVQEAAQARYTNVQVNKEVLKYFMDFEILPPSADSENPEPEYYLPIIPWVLVNGVRGMAIGFATSILPRSPENLSKACQSFLKGDDIDPSLLVPVFPNFRGTVDQDPSDPLRWFVKGSFERQGKTGILITEVPYGYDRASYIEKLELLRSKGRITSYVDRCSKVGFRFEVRMNGLDKMSDEKVLSDLYLVKSYKENIVVISQDTSVHVFDSAESLLKQFCTARLEFYSTRYQYRIKRDTEDLEKTDAKIRFIEMILDQRITIEGKTKAQLMKELAGRGFGTNVLDTLLSMPIYHLCKDKLDELKRKSKSLSKDIVTWKNTNSTKAFVKDLEGV